MAYPVSWYVVEKGWKVLAADGSEIGTVDEVLGDENADIFDGLAVSRGVVAATVYVPAESVDGIVEGAITLTTGPDEVEALPPYSS